MNSRLVRSAWIGAALRCRCAIGAGLVALLLSAALLLLVWLYLSVAQAHDNWIWESQQRNGAGEWCCGEKDCFVVPSQSVRLAADGYHLFEVETVPLAEAQPSPDGAFWRCRRPDGSRRCFFAPPPNT